MDAKAALKYARTWARHWSRVLGLKGWEIRIRLSCDCDRACVRTHPEYQVADVEINPDGNHAEADIRDAMRHELLHVVTSPMDLLHDAHASLYDEGSNERKLLDEVARQVAELLVVNAERMYQAILRDQGGKK